MVGEGEGGGNLREGPVATVQAVSAGPAPTLTVSGSSWWPATPGPRQGWLTRVVSSASKVMRRRRRTLGLGLALKCGTPEGAGDVRDGKTNNSDLSSLCNSLPPS